jgi:hypothetical protein
MKKLLSLLILTLAFSFAAVAQEKEEHAKPTDADKQANFDASGVISRGAALSDKAEKVSLSEAIKNPEKFAGKTVLVEGVIVRSCKKEGCWMELAADKQSPSVRVSMKKHSFFIPLESAGYKAKAEGVLTVKTLSKEMVDHLIKDDGAKFDKRNPDGTVTEVSFEATGVELRKS